MRLVKGSKSYNVPLKCTWYNSTRVVAAFVSKARRVDETNVPTLKTIHSWLSISIICSTTIIFSVHSTIIVALTKHVIL